MDARCPECERVAKLDDDIYVSGTLGDSALGLKCLIGDITPKDDILIGRYYLPRPRLGLGQSLKD